MTVVKLTLAMILLFGAIVCLYFTRSDAVRLGLLGGFTALFCLTMLATTTASRGEMFGATAAYVHESSRTLRPVLTPLQLRRGSGCVYQRRHIIGLIVVGQWKVVMVERIWKLKTEGRMFVKTRRS